MIEFPITLTSGGSVCLPGHAFALALGYTKNRGVYRLTVTASGEWEGLTIRAFWHVPGGKDPASSLVADGSVAVPASVTAQPGSGCVTFEGSDGTKTVTSADLRYRVAANSGTEDGTQPEPGTPAWQELVGAVHTDATAAEQAKTDAQTAATESAASAEKAAASKKAAEDAKAKAAESLQELKNGIASGNFKGDPGVSPTVTVQDITGGHRIVITDETGTSSVDVLNGKQGDPGKPGDTGATPELTIGTVKEGDAPSATITGTVKKPILNLTLKSGAPGKDATVDATLTQSGKAADAKVTGDALATKAVIDDTTVGTDAWSAKHLVDVLCPPIEETGNPVQCYPVVGSKLGCKVSWEPTQEGSGEPSPENVRPIKGRDSVTAERCGENLLDILKYTPNGYNLAGKNILKPNTTYTFSPIKSGNIAFAVFLTDSIEPTESKKQMNLTGIYCNEGKSVTFTTPNETSEFPYIWIAGAKSGIHLVWPDVKFMLAVDTTAPAAYTPYQGDTLDLQLPGTVYGGNVDAVTGEGQETWKIATIDAKKIKFSSDGNDRFWNLPNHTADGATGASKIICSHFISSTFSVNEPYAFFFTQPNRLQNLFSSVDELNDYCAAQYAAGTPVQIVYQSLKEPVPITATGAQPIPALNGVNTMMTDADSVTVTGRADPIKRITDLEDAVASMTNT